MPITDNIVTHQKNKELKTNLTGNDTSFKVTFNNDTYNPNKQLPFKNKKQATLDRYWNNAFINNTNNKNNLINKNGTVLLNWEIVSYYPKYKDRVNHYINGDLKSGKGWITSDILNIKIKNNNYLEILTTYGSLYNLYLSDCICDDYNKKNNILYLAPQ